MDNELTVSEAEHGMQMRLPISLRALFVVVTFAAIATSALLHPTFFVASITWSLTLLILGAAIVAAFCSVGTSRAFWAGFAFFGCIHMILAVAPWFDDHTGEFIVTRQVLDKLGGILEYKVADLTSMPGIWLNLPYAYNDSPKSGYPYLSYLMVGQSIFSVIIACIGGLLARYFYSRRSTT